MPIVSVLRDKLFEALGESFTLEEFEQLCFDFGIELDDVTSEAAMFAKMKGVEAAPNLSTDVIYKIDIPANRYDLLCLEGLARALRVYRQSEDPPEYIVDDVADPLTMRVSPSTKQIRPYVVAAVLRNVSFNATTFKSFIDLQDKLHQNICRERSLVAIGTHDLDTITPPFTYEALPPNDISFRALKEDKVMTAAQLFGHYRAQAQCEVRKYLPLIESSPVYPVIRDSKGNVLSLPPIINSHLSRITLDTRNVFIEVTATDLTKAHIVLNTIVCMFGQYTTPRAFVAEPVNIVDWEGRPVERTPTLKVQQYQTTADYINRGIGTSIKPDDMVGLLNRMQIKATLANDGTITCEVPPTRSDVLHPCDIMEDVAIGYGFNRIAKTLPKCYTMARQQPVAVLSDLLRGGLAEAGFTEVLTWALVSKSENYEKVRQQDDGRGVTVGNPKTAEFEMVRTSLTPGLLKTLAHNRANLNLPIRLFELSDVVFIDPGNANGARNERRIAALYCARSAGFDIIHGLLDRIMTLNNVRHGDSEEERHSGSKPPIGMYVVTGSANTTFVPNLCADIMFTAAGSERSVCLGSMGVIHPEVLEKFHIDSPCSLLEISIEPLLVAGKPISS
ncbi:phenylalanine--tRNA ligase [Plasmodiophora brassicae]